MSGLGAGQGPCGGTPCGFDAVVEGVEAGASDAARALFFDLRTREFPPTEDGALQEVHWVDAAVALAIGFVLGSIPAAPEVGFNTLRLKRISRLVAQQATTNEVRASLSALIANGDITLVSVEVETRAIGRLFTRITYVNERLQSAGTNRTATTLSLGG